MTEFFQHNLEETLPPTLLTFDRLAQETAHKLRNTDVTPEMVRDVLQDAGIDECMRQAAPDTKGRLIVHQVTLTGEKRRAGSPTAEHFKYERRLGSGLWAWVGPNGAGKSTILNSIIWALTGSDSDLSRRVRSWLNDVVLWFSVGGDEFTSRVNRSNTDNISGGVYNGFHSLDQIDLGEATPVLLFNSRDEMREALDLFFMQQLGISTLRWTAHSSQKDDPDLHAHSTTWRTYAHAIHIEDDSYDDLIIDPQKGYGRQDRKILEMMLGVDHARVVAEIQVQADFAKEAHGRARSRISGRQEDITGQLLALEQELADLQQAINLMQSEATVVEDDSALVAKRERRAALLAEQNQLSEEIAALETQQDELERNILEAERAKVAVREQSEVEYLINSLAVVRCPHCESSVDDQTRLAKERHEHTCHVCMQPIQRQRAPGDLNAILRERDEDMTGMRKALRRIQDDINERAKQIADGREEVARLGKALESSVGQARQGFTASYTGLLVHKGQLEGQIEQLRRNQTEIASEQLEVETASRWHLILQTAAEIADESVYSMYQNVFAELSHMVVKLASDFGLPDLEQVIIDEKRYVKLVQGGLTIGHNDLARSERVKFKVAFHLALMLIQVRAGLGKHPGFLIIDTPGTAEVDDIDLIAMTRDLAGIHAQYGDQVQILMATARQEALGQLPPGLVATPVNGTLF